jgi:hypothetical protein
MSSNPPSGGDKKTENVKVWMDERLFVDLNRLAMLDDRKLSEYIELILRRHCYGQSSRRVPEGEGAERDD